MPDPNNILDAPTKTAWLLVPKVANTAIKRAILEWKGHHIPNDEYLLHNHDDFEFASTKTIATGYSHYLRVAFCRNPWDRLVSCWKDKCGRSGFWESLPMFGLHTGMTFEDFLWVVCSQEDHEQNIHYRSLSALLNYRNQQAFNVLCKFERLDDDWAKLQAKVPGLPGLRKSNVTDHKPWWDYYSKEMFTKVAYRYAADIVRFGYVDDLERIGSLGKDDKNLQQQEGI